METQQQSPLVHVPVNSSAVASVGYHPQSKLLQVRMKNSDGTPGKTYDYPGVSEVDHAELMAAPSIGKHLASKIRPKYSTTVKK